MFCISACKKRIHVYVFSMNVNFSCRYQVQIVNGLQNEKQLCFSWLHHLASVPLFACSSFSHLFQSHSGCCWQIPGNFCWPLSSTWLPCSVYINRLLHLCLSALTQYFILYIILISCICHMTHNVLIALCVCGRFACY